MMTVGTSSEVLQMKRSIFQSMGTSLSSSFTDLVTTCEEQSTHVSLYRIVNCSISVVALGGRSRKRRRTDNVDIEDRLESLITRVGEKVNVATSLEIFVLPSYLTPLTFVQLFT